MPIESDNDAEREARIAEILRKIRETQERVERLAAEVHSRAQDLEREQQRRILLTSRPQNPT